MWSFSKGMMIERAMVRRLNPCFVGMWSFSCMKDAVQMKL